MKSEKDVAGPSDRSRSGQMRHAVVLIPSFFAVVVGLLVAAMAGAAGSHASPRELSTPGLSARSSNHAAACPLTPAQEQRAVDAFDKMQPVIFNPRCLNCHGGVNPYVDPQVGRHLGGQMTDSTGAAMPDASCQDCHGELPGWQVAPTPVFFIGKSAKELCMQFKEFAPDGPADFVAHMETEHGGIQFIGAAFIGKRALTTLGEVSYEEQTGRPLAAEPPPGTRADLVAKARVWANAIGSAGWTDRECGCMVHGAWSGTVSARGTIKGSGAGTLTVASDAVVMLETDPSWSGARADPRSQYYKSTGGMVTWHVRASEGCRGAQEGTMPLDTVDVDGHPMAELRVENLGNGSFSYESTIGSWPDRWAPLFNVRCDISGQTVEIPTTNLLSGWWQWDPQNAPVTRDPNRLKGSYRWNAGGIDVLWQWDLKRQP